MPEDVAAALEDDGTALEARFERLRAAFDLRAAPPLAARRAKLGALDAAIRARGDAIVRAVAADFGRRPEPEMLMGEVAVVLGAIGHARRRLRRWMRPRRSLTAFPAPGRALVLREPKGVVGVLSPWNYPFQLSMLPFATAVAAGNKVVLKPSERAPATADVVAALVAEVFDPDEASVVLGDAEVARRFAALPFDHLFFTGSTMVGRLVAEAAARNLTPVTLELGGKSPCVMMPDAAPARHAPMVAWGKWFGAGQTCIAPDYLLVPRGSAEAWARALAEGARRFLDPEHGSPDYTAIISPRHLARLRDMIEEAESSGATAIRVGEEAVSGRQMAPAIVLGAPPDSRLMQEEVFGPVLPIVEYDDLDGARALIAAREHPLALYAFGRNAGRALAFVRSVRSGGAMVNGTVLHAAAPGLPFGGVGPSGMGAYHGERGFLEMSHERVVLVAPQTRLMHRILPPYPDALRHAMRWMTR